MESLSVLAIKRRPSMHICLYAPRSYVFAIEYAKPEDLLMLWEHKN
jgi:hypothetical protein